MKVLGPEGLVDNGIDVIDEVNTKTTLTQVRTDIGARFQVGGEEPADTNVVWLRPA